MITERMKMVKETHRLIIDYVHGHGFVVRVHDFNSLGFSASGYGETVEEALEMLDQEIACESINELPDWAVAAVQQK
jgi:hypothetical protein